MIKELEELKAQHGDKSVFMASDAEGNEYSQYDEASIVIVDSYGDSYSEEDVKDLIEYEGFEEKDFEKILILWRV